MKARVFFSVTLVALGLSLAIADCGSGQAVAPHYGMGVTKHLGLRKANRASTVLVLPPPGG